MGKKARSIKEARRAAVRRVQEWRKRHKLQYKQLERKTYWRKRGITGYTGKSAALVSMNDKAAQEIAQLRADLHKWNYEYYVWSAPSVEDAEYDRSMDRLRQLEKERPDLADPNSPTVRVGSKELSSFVKVRHQTPMLSLEKANTVAEVVRFFGHLKKPVMGMVEPKIDGLSLSLRYVRGVLVRAATRGDGSVGDDVTVNARTIKTLPLVLPKQLSLEVRGEVFMRWSDFDDYNRQLQEAGEELTANPRNAASGALKLKHSIEAAQRKLSFMAYSVDGDIGEETNQGVLRWLEEAKFMTTSACPLPLQSCESMTQYEIDLSREEDVTDIVNRLEAARRFQNFPTDGLVFKVDSLALQADLGAGTKAPKWALAYKFQPDRANTALKGVTVTVGKTGKLTPVAELAPVVVSGSTVSAASLCNWDETKRLNLNIGDQVTIEKSGDIIPKIIAVAIKHSKGALPVPKVCPACGQPVKKLEGLVDLYCTNLGCAAQVEARLRYAVGKNCLDIDGCGEQTVKLLIEAGVQTLADLFRINKLDFLKPAAKKKLIEGREKAKDAPFWRRLNALCIDGIGVQMSQEIAARWPNILSIVDALEAEPCPLKELIKEVKFNSLKGWLAENEAYVVDLCGLKFLNSKVGDGVATGSAAGKSFCITGDLPMGIKRHQAMDKIIERGGLYRTSVSRKVDFLVVGDGGGVNKARDAEKNGTQRITPEEFFRMLEWEPEITPPAQNGEY